MLIKHKEPL